MVFLGYSDVLLDPKHRLAIPAKFRRNLELEKGDLGQLVLVPGAPDNTLWLYPEKVFIQLVGQAKSSLIPGEDLRRFDQAYFPVGEVLEADSQGRILIPDRLIEESGLGREVVMCGVRDHLEIWPRDAFQKHMAESKARFHELHSRARDAYQEPMRRPSRDDWANP
ncbi:MAG TPA: hypothetical protein VNT79_17990 [Phycisphaerae bacterium]|nr:hypothetical protein [Phycisphaerae bacterium]